MYNCVLKAKKVYVVCPAGVKTGGPELLHQLVFELRRVGVDAYIVYVQSTAEFTIEKSFLKYVSDYIRFDDIEDEENNIVIFPEVYVNKINMISKAKICIWWLSVDFYCERYDIKTIVKRKKIKSLIRYFAGNWKYRINLIKNKVDINLTQSYYAFDFLKKQGFPKIEYLSDYLNTSYLSIDISNYERENRVLYNPKKGMRFTQQLIDSEKELNWVPLINLTNEEVINLLCTSKVYVDFGNHPGKDRFPREAAMCGCCVITGLDGAAKFWEDVPIDDFFKIEAEKKNIDLINSRIKDCMNNYKNYCHCFDMYRDKIREEYSGFQGDVRRIFIE